METIKQNVVLFFDKTWLKVNAILGVEQMKDLGSFQLVLNNILADPLLLVLALGIIAIIPYIINKIRTAHTEKEKRLDALLQELENLEENEEIDRGNPLFKNQPKGEVINHPNESLGILENEAYGNEFESSGSEKINDSLEKLNPIIQENFNDDLDWDSSNDKWSDLYDHIVQEPDESEQVPTHQSLKMGGDISENTLAQKPLKKMDKDLSWESNLDEWDELYDSVAEKPLEVDIPTKNSIKKENLSPEIVPTELTTEKEDQEELDKFADSLEAFSKIEKESIEVIPEEENLEEVTDFLEAVSELEKEPIETIPEEEKSEEVTDFLEAVSELEKEPIETIAEEEKSEEVTNFLEAVSELEKESIETIAEEEKSEEVTDFLEAVSELEKESIETVPAFNIPERIELSLEEIEPEELKPNLIKQAETTSSPHHSTPIKENPLTAGPLLNSMLNSSVSAKTDALVSRLKTFQAELETRFQSLETEPEEVQEITKTTSKKGNDYQPAGVNYKSIRKSRSNKEYLRQLESFIFMAKQKDINSD